MSDTCTSCNAYSQLLFMNMEVKVAFLLVFFKSVVLVVESRHLSRSEPIQPRPSGSWTQLSSSRSLPDIHRQEVVRSTLQLNPTILNSRQQLRPGQLEYSHNLHVQRGSRQDGSRRLGVFRTPRRQYLPATVIQGDQILRRSRILSGARRFPTLTSQRLRTLSNGRRTLSSQHTGLLSSQPTGILSRRRTGTLASQRTGIFLNRRAGALSSRRTGILSNRRIGTDSNRGTEHRSRTRGYIALLRSPYGTRLIQNGRLRPSVRSRSNQRLQSSHNTPGSNNRQTLRLTQMPRFGTITVRSNSDDDDDSRIIDNRYNIVNTVNTDNRPVHFNIEQNSEGTSVQFGTPHRSELPRRNRNTVTGPSQKFLSHELKKLNIVNKQKGAYPGAVFPENSFIYQEQPDSNSESPIKQEVNHELGEGNTLLATKTLLAKELGQNTDIVSLIQSLVKIVDPIRLQESIVPKDQVILAETAVDSNVQINSDVPENIVKSAETINVVDPVSSVDTLVQDYSAVPLDTLNPADSIINLDPLLPVDSIVPVDLVKQAETSLVKDSVLSLDSSVDTAKTAENSIVVDPIIPVDSTVQVDTALPVDIVKPDETSIVVDPVVIVDSTVQIDTAVPVDIEKPAETSIVVDPVVSVDSIIPADTAVPVDIVKPAETSNVVDPVDSIIPADTVVPVDIGKPAETSIIVDPATPVDSTVQVETSVPVDIVKPAETSIIDSALPVDLITPVEPVYTIETNPAVNPINSVESTISVHPIDTVILADPVSTVDQVASVDNNNTQNDLLIPADPVGPLIQ